MVCRSPFPTQDTNKHEVQQNMDELTRCTTVFHVRKTLSEFTTLPREGECQRQGGGADGEVGPTHMKERVKGNDRLIYSKSEEWVNQTLMALGSASCSLSLFVHPVFFSLTLFLLFFHFHCTVPTIALFLSL